MMYKVDIFISLISRIIIKMNFLLQISNQNLTIGDRSFGGCSVR
jgi:hypothetical protein